MRFHGLSLLMFCNILSAALGFAQGLWVAHTLGPAGLGVIAVLTTFGWLAVNFWDMRLGDLATKMHYDFADNPAHQTATMWVGVGLNALLALAGGGTMLLLALFTSHWFLDNPPALWWIMGQCCVLVSNTLVSNIQSMHRLTGAMTIFALSRLGNQVLILAALAAGILTHPNLDGYYYGQAGGAVLSGLFSFMLLLYLWRRYVSAATAAGYWRIAWREYTKQTHFIVSGNVMSYGKMLTRGADVLLLSYFASDAITGVYRLARSLADSLGIFAQALYQYFSPQIISALSRQKEAEMVRIARGLFLLSLLTFMGAPVAYFLLMWINNTYLKGAYVGLEFTTALLLLSYFWTVGVNIALWPCVMQEKQTHKMALWNLLGGLAHIGTIALGAYYGYATPAVAAMGVVLYNLVTYTPLMYWWYYRYRAFL